MCFIQTSLPKGVQKRSAKKTPVSSGPKKGKRLTVKPKNRAKIEQMKVQKEVTKFINKKNEELVQSRASATHSTPPNATSSKSK